MDALVTDVHFRSAVAGVRGLGRAGLEVIALGPGRAAAGRWYRYASRRGVAPEVASTLSGTMPRSITAAPSVRASAISAKPLE